MKCGTRAALDATVCAVCGDILQSELVAKSHKIEPVEVKSEPVKPETQTQEQIPVPSQPHEIVLVMPEQEKSLSTPRFITLVSALVFGTIVLSIGYYFKHTIIEVQPVTHEIHTTSVVTEYVPQATPQPTSQPQQITQLSQPEIKAQPQPQPQIIPQQSQAPQEQVPALQPSQPVEKAITEENTVIYNADSYWISSTDSSIKIRQNKHTMKLTDKMSELDEQTKHALLGHKVGDWVTIVYSKSQLPAKFQSFCPANCDSIENDYQILEVK